MSSPPLEQLLAQLRGQHRRPQLPHRFFPSRVPKRMSNLRMKAQPALQPSADRSGPQLKLPPLLCWPEPARRSRPSNLDPAGLVSPRRKFPVRRPLPSSPSSCLHLHRRFPPRSPLVQKQLPSGLTPSPERRNLLARPQELSLHW